MEKTKPINTSWRCQWFSEKF